MELDELKAKIFELLREDLRFRYAENTDEILKLLKKADVVKAKYSREPRKILRSAKRKTAKEMKKIAEEKGVELIKKGIGALRLVGDY